MKKLRFFLPFYRKTVKRMSKGYGLGKTKPGKLLLKIFTWMVRSDFVEVQGHNMFLHPGNDDYSLYGVYGELDTEIVKNEINKGDIVVDVGASIGYFTLIFARSVGKEGHVFAFEPRPERFELLKKNVEINGYDNVTIEQMAVMDQNGETDFYFSKNEKTGFKLEVSEDQKNIISEKGVAKTIRLEDYFKEKNLLNKIKFIKSDVDGPEFAVLKSAGSILENKSLKIFFEWDYEYIEIAGDNPEEMLELLYKNGFKIYSPDFKNNKYSPIDKNRLLSFKTVDTVNLLCKKE
jgi:FkbM family methyltransferase